MAKYYGKVGYIVTEEVKPGVWVERPVELPYYGDVLKAVRRWQTSSDKQNDDLQVNNQISIVSDPFAMNNFQSMRYIEWMGALWKIESVEVQFPRLILSIGGVYNGRSASSETS